MSFYEIVIGFLILYFVNDVIQPEWEGLGSDVSRLLGLDSGHSRSH